MKLRRGAGATQDVVAAAAAEEVSQSVSPLREAHCVCGQSVSQETFVSHIATCLAWQKSVAWIRALRRSEETIEQKYGDV